MRVIQTRYKGYHFRSRLEARWAVYFDYIGLKWDYEVEGFEFKDGTRYLPDFWLPELNLWVEVKGVIPESSAHPDIEKITKLRDSTDRAVLVVKTPDEYGWWVGYDYGDSSGGASLPLLAGLLVYNSSVHVVVEGAPNRDYFNDSAGNFETPCVFGQPRLHSQSVRAVGALQAFRSARFEFGDKK